MARCGVPGIDLPNEPDPNEHTDECGCRWVRVAAAGTRPEGWVRLRTCPEHAKEIP
jgi:hypothetical protein